MILLNEFKNKKKLFSKNLDIEFNFTSSFLREYEIKNKLLSISEKENEQQINKAQKQSTNLKNVYNNLIKNIDRQMSIIKSGSELQNKQFERQITLNKTLPENINKQIEKQTTINNIGSDYSNKHVDRQLTILKSSPDDLNIEFGGQPTFSKNGSQYTIKDLKPTNIKFSQEDKKKVSLFSSEVDVIFFFYLDKSCL